MFYWLSIDYWCEELFQVNFCWHIVCIVSWIIQLYWINIIILIYFLLLLVASFVMFRILSPKFSVQGCRIILSWKMLLNPSETMACVYNLFIPSILAPELHLWILRDYSSMSYKLPCLPELIFCYSKYCTTKVKKCSTKDNISEPKNTYDKQIWQLCL